LDETKQKIIDATMELLKEKGYVATTTKDIAGRAKVNECTIFRKFESKKDIVIRGMEQEKWRADITPDVFQNITWELKADLEMFMRNYLDRVTEDFVKLSIGLRAPQISDEIMPFVMKIPETFLSELTGYFEKMHEKGKLGAFDFQCLAMIIFSSTFGYTFLKASFGEKLTKVNQEEFISKSVALFLKGIQS